MLILIWIIYGYISSAMKSNIYDIYFCLSCQFLTTYDYGPVSVKSLQTPSVKDFLKIFSFIYKLLCPSYELPSTKSEEEIPRIFKDLGYVSKLYTSDRTLDSLELLSV